MTDILILTAIVLILLGVASFALLQWPKPRASHPSLLDTEGHRRADPPIDLRALDQDVARGK